MPRRKKLVDLERKHVLLHAGDFDKIKEMYPKFGPSTVIAQLVHAFVLKHELSKPRLPANLEVNPDELERIFNSELDSLRDPDRESLEGSQTTEPRGNLPS